MSSSIYFRLMIFKEKYNNNIHQNRLSCVSLLYCGKKTKINNTVNDNANQRKFSDLENKRKTLKGKRKRNIKNKILPWQLVYVTKFVIFFFLWVD